MRANKLVLLATLLAPLAAGAQVHDWSVKPGKGNGSPTAAVTYFDQNVESQSYYAVDKTLYGVESRMGTAVGSGSVTTGKGVENFPSVVPLADGKRYIFIASQDGYIYKIDADTMTTSATKDMRRGACAADSLQATPTVQIAAYSNAQFKAATGSRDLVYVPTYHGCGDTTQNQVVALYADDLTTAWTFNIGEYEMDFIAEGCSLDYDNNRLYCGSNLSAAAYQNTVWAIGSSDGSLVWAGNFNSVRTRPQLARGTNNHLYIADYIGNLHAVDRDTGTESWSLAVTSSAGGGVAAYLAVNMWAEFRPPYQDTIFVTDSTGVLHAVYDSGPIDEGGIEAWSTSFASGQKVQSLGSVSPTLGKLYVGLSDGTVHQLNLASGSDEASRTINAAPLSGDVVTDPTLHLNGGNEISKLVVSANGSTIGTVTKQFTVPWAYSSTGASLTSCTKDTDCVALNTPANCDNSAGKACCSTGTCNVADGVCYSTPKNGTADCDDGKGTCTANKQCVAGACIGEWDNNKCGGADPKNCDKDPIRGCGKGYTCVYDNHAYKCVDLKSDTDYCGGIARTCTDGSDKRSGVQAWGGDRVCNKGICERQLDFCQTAIPTDITNAHPNLSGLAFVRFNVSGKNLCHAWVSTYDVKDSANPLLRVDENANVASYPPEQGPGFSGGVGTVASNNAVFTSFINPLGAGRWNGNNQVDLLRGFGAGTGPLLTDGGTAGPFRFKEFNVGPTAPSSDDIAPAMGGRLFYGNWRQNGDVWTIGLQGANWQANPIYPQECPPQWCPDSGAAPPACPNKPCGPDDRITATDFFHGALGDGKLRIAHKGEVIVYDLTQRKISSRVAMKQGYWTKTKNGFDAADAKQIVALTADPLNGNMGCIVEVVDGPTGKTYLVHVSNDGALRLYADLYQDQWKGAWPPPQNTNGQVPPTSFGDGDGRVAASSQQYLYRMNTIDPSTTKKNNMVWIPLPR